MEKCVSCAFYDRGSDKEASGPSWGQCRRTSPALHPVNVKAYMIEGVWPHVRDDDWCGEWRSHARHARGEAGAGLRSAAMAAQPEPIAASRPQPPARPSMLTPLPGAAGAHRAAGAMPAPPMSPVMAPPGSAD